MIIVQRVDDPLTRAKKVYVLTLEMECKKLRSELLTTIATVRTSQDIESGLKAFLRHAMNSQLSWITLFIMALSMYVIVFHRVV